MLVLRQACFQLVYSSRPKYVWRKTPASASLLSGSFLELIPPLRCHCNLSKQWLKHTSTLQNLPNNAEYVSCGAQVNELRTQNEYQLRLKDMAQNEKIREINEKYTAELEGSKLKLEAFVQVCKSLLSSSTEQAILRWVHLEQHDSYCQSLMPS